MSNKNKKEQKKFGKGIGKRILVGASSSIVAGLMIVGANPAFADTTADYVPASFEQSTGGLGMHMMRSWNSDAKAGKLALQLGLDPEEVKQEIKSGKTLKQILQDNGIVPGQLQKAFSSNRKHNWKRSK